jgi:hypothetical protein
MCYRGPDGDHLGHFCIYIYFIFQTKKRQPQSCSVQITRSPHSLADPAQRTWVREGRVRTPGSGGKWCAVYRAGFVGERPGRWPRDLRKTKIEPQTPSRYLPLLNHENLAGTCVFVRNKNKQNYHNLNLMFESPPPHIFRLPWGSHNFKPGPGSVANTISFSLCDAMTGRAGRLHRNWGDLDRSNLETKYHCLCATV